jgi:predicted aspartyl protease
MEVFFGDKSFIDIERQDGLFYVTLNTVFEGSPADGVALHLVLDTGAYITVISRGTAERCGFDRLPKKATTFSGFCGSMNADFVRIPGLMILGRLITNVPVLIPHDMYHIDEKTGKMRQTQEVLGLNVLEYYKFYVDTENDRLYLQENQNSRFYDSELESGRVFVANAES